MAKLIASRFKNKYCMEDRQSFPFCYLLVGIPFIFFLIFWVYVNISSIFISFQDFRGNFTLQNFKDVFTAFVDKDIYGWNLSQIMWRTFRLWLYVNLLCLLPIALSSYVLYKKIWGHYVFRVIFMIPTVISGIVFTLITKNMVALNGPVIMLLNKLGWETPMEVQITGSLLTAPDTSFVTIVLINLIPHLVGFNIIIQGAFARLPEELFEVGRLEGMGFFREFFTVSLPLIWPTLTVSLISLLATMFTVEGGVFIYTKGAYNTGTMGFYLYWLTLKLSEAAGVETVNYGYPAAIGLVITCITVPIVLICKKLMGKFQETIEY